MVNIASNSGLAQTAVSDVTTVSVDMGEQVSLYKSNLSSMKSGKKLNNQLLTDLVDLINCVQEQSEKFPKIAKMMDLQDSQIKF
ncbi:hypothetical protein JI640_08845 [Listeria ivanovii subsp. londoniensis]|uniref:hypothetical protein n=1 Tax=Listeria ivanovii TaxID=1638 RepID=UPI001903BE12|nr:hypothetical protein [Listeria ivanovii]MBK1983957.1 hypothetical protein [Listeria ivanovii subsp. londoniensis]MBK1996033.1 hypothetical protein [Listeria ivanovii subsp. londoniensis]